MKKWRMAGLIILMIALCAVSAGAESGWQSNQNGWWYDNGDGSYPVSQWKEINGKWYYFDGGGYMMTGWQLLNGKWYLFSSDGAMQKGWVQRGGEWYYLDKDGVLSTGWKKIDGEWYLFDGNGVMQTGHMQIGGAKYFLQDNGVMARGKWEQAGSDWYFYTEDGPMATGWIEDHDAWYYFDIDGKMVTGWLRQGESWYYMLSSGAMAKGWQQISGAWYFFTKDGPMAVGWVQDKNNWYYFDSVGRMVTGWLQQGASWYYFGSGGAMVTGLQEIGNDYYLFDGNGRMQNGNTDAVNSLSALIDQLESARKQGQKSIAFYINSAFLDSYGDKIGDILGSHGVFFESGNGIEYCYWNAESFPNPILEITSDGSVSGIWYPGQTIAIAVQTGKTGSLPALYKQTLNAARGVISGISGSSLEKALTIKDRLAGRISYQIVEGSWRDDCAVGALLDGKANCDGYSDAFYLCATLAGVDTRLVLGDSRSSGSLPGQNEGGHAWNMIQINGSWRAMDVTWEDGSADLDMDMYANQGLNDMRENYVWYSEVMPGAILEKTSLAEKRVFSVAVNSWDEIRQALRSSKQKGAPAIALYLSDEMRVSSGLNSLPLWELLSIEGGDASRAYTYDQRGICVYRDLTWKNVLTGKTSNLSELAAMTEQAVKEKREGMAVEMTSSLYSEFLEKMWDVIGPIYDAGYTCSYLYLDRVGGLRLYFHAE